MAHLRRMTYTKPIPAGAEIVSHKGKLHARYKGDDDRQILAPLTRKGDRIRLRSEKWYGVYRDANDAVQTVPLSADKTAAQQMLAELVLKVERVRAGLADPKAEAHRKTPLAEHLADWERSLLADGSTAKHVRQTVACVRRLLKDCQFVFISDLSASRVQQFLADLRRPRSAALSPDPGKEWYTRKELATLLGVKPSAIPPAVRQHRLAAQGKGKARRYPRATAEALSALRSRGRSIKTSNLYLDAVKGFCAWLVRDRRTGENPLAHLEGGNVKLDRRHDRQTLTAEQLAAILAAAAASKKVFRGLGGRDRHALYLCAMGTGFRAGELASLLPEWFTLNADPPTVALPAREDRAGRFVTQPLPSAIAEALLEYLKGRPAGQPVWPGTWVEKAAEMLRLDLEAAGIPYVVEGPDGPLYADFHALRHSYIALLDKSGATLKEAMHLARHSDPKLTMAVYGRSRLHDLGRRAEKLSDLLLPGEGSRVSALVATGTDGHLPPDDSSAFPVAFTSREASSTPVKPVGGKGLVEEDSPGNEQPLAVQGVEKPCIPLRAIEEAPRA